MPAEPNRAMRLRSALTVPLRARFLAIVYLCLLFVGCPCFREPINSSPELRWWLFSRFGVERLCPEMLKRSAPLKLVPNPNVVGRFFPGGCQAIANDQTQTVTLTFSGAGLAWTPIANRVAFTVSASVEYRMDFYLEEDAVYIWAKQARVVAPPDFKVTAVEYSLANWAAQGPAGYLFSAFGGQIVSGQLASGFTVVHTEDGDEFALGQLTPPSRPPRPFDTSEERFTYANETSEVHSEQIDLIGPFAVNNNEQALFLRTMLTGPPVDVLVLHRGSGDLWRAGLQQGAPLGPPPQPPVANFTIQPGMELRQRIPLAPAEYYLVIDNSSRAGSVNPPWSPLGAVGGNAAVVSYAVELGDADEDF
jgi:hypothetical protein